NCTPDQPSRDEGPDTIKGAVRHVDDPHDSEDEAEARSDEKQYRGVEQRVENLDGQYVHAISLKRLTRQHPSSVLRLRAKPSRTARTPNAHKYRRGDGTAAAEMARARSFQSYSRARA